MGDEEQRLKALMVAAMDGDDAAYRVALGHLAEHLRAFFRRRLGARPQDCEDLVQETLLAMHTRRHTFDRAEPFTPWVFAIARYKLVDWQRRHARREALHDPMEDRQDELAVAPPQEAEDARRDVADLLEGLPAKQREPIRLVKLEGLSITEAAARTGLSVSAVKVGIHRGLKKLAARLGR
jgi:RNA polymerase sigma-70 factor (ECF subfamily)